MTSARVTHPACTSCLFPAPFSRAIHVKTALDVDRVTGIKVGAKDGTELVFESIEIGNKPTAPDKIISLVDRLARNGSARSCTTRCTTS